MTPPSAAGKSAAASGPRITVDDLRHKALAVRDMARDERRHLLQDDRTRVVIASAVVFAVVLSAAYYLGTRAARPSRPRPGQ